MTVGYSEMGTRVGYGRAAPQTGFTSCQILTECNYAQNSASKLSDGGHRRISQCVYSLGTFSVICAELLPQELTSVSPHVIIAQSDYEEREGEGERSRSRRSG